MRYLGRRRRARLEEEARRYRAIQEAWRLAKLGLDFDVEMIPPGMVEPLTYLKHVHRAGETSRRLRP